MIKRIETFSKINVKNTLKQFEVIVRDKEFVKQLVHGEEVCSMYGNKCRPTTMPENALN